MDDSRSFKPVNQNDYPLPPPSEYELDKYESIPLIDVEILKEMKVKPEENESNQSDDLKEVFIQFDDLKMRNDYLEKLLVEKDERALAAESEKFRILEVFSLMLLLNFVMFGYFFVWNKMG